MSIQHHLTDEILIAYAAGNLPEAFNLIVAAHISLCDACRAQSESFDAVGGSLMEESETEVVSADSFEATLRLIEAGDMAEQPAPRVSSGVFPAPLADVCYPYFSSLRIFGNPVRVPGAYGIKFF